MARAVLADRLDQSPDPRAAVPVVPLLANPEEDLARAADLPAQFRVEGLLPSPGLVGLRPARVGAGHDRDDAIPARVIVAAPDGEDRVAQGVDRRGEGPRLAARASEGVVGIGLPATGASPLPRRRSAGPHVHVLEVEIQGARLVVLDETPERGATAPGQLPVARAVALGLVVVDVGPEVAFLAGLPALHPVAGADRPVRVGLAVPEPQAREETEERAQAEPGGVAVEREIARALERLGDAPGVEGVRADVQLVPEHEPRVEAPAPVGPAERVTGVVHDQDARRVVPVAPPRDGLDEARRGVKEALSLSRVEHGPLGRDEHGIGLGARQPLE